MAARMKLVTINRYIISKQLKVRNNLPVDGRSCMSEALATFRHWCPGTRQRLPTVLQTMPILASKLTPCAPQTMPRLASKLTPCAPQTMPRLASKLTPCAPQTMPRLASKLTPWPTQVVCVNSSTPGTKLLTHHCLSHQLAPGFCTKSSCHGHFLQFSRSFLTATCLGRDFTSANRTFSLASIHKYQDKCGNCGIKRNVGRSSRHQDIDVNNSSSSIHITNTKHRLHDRTGVFLKGRVSRLHSSLLNHKARLRENMKAQRVRGVLAASAHHKFKVQREDVRTIPNMLTTLRMLSAPVLSYLVVSESFGLACSLLIMAGITDVLDGYIARNFKNQTTALGMALDPLADKLLVCFLTLSLTSVGLIPVLMTGLILSRDAVLIAGSFYIRYITLSPPRTLSRYFDVAHVTVRLHPSKISKANTFLQLTYVASCLASPVFDCVGHPLLQALMYLTAATTFLSGADYMLTWRQRLQIVKNE